MSQSNTKYIKVASITIEDPRIHSGPGENLRVGIMYMERTPESTMEIDVANPFRMLSRVAHTGLSADPLDQPAQRHQPLGHPSLGKIRRERWRLHQ